MKKLKILIITTFIITFCLSVATHAQKTEDDVTTRAINLLKNMSLKEKIGQKLMLDFRYWCAIPSQEAKSCTQDFTMMNQMVHQIISKNHIGGIILFSNNIKNIEQITTLTYAFQNAMYESNKLGLIIAADQEGGIVARLPRDVAVSFPGNIAITAAYLGNKNSTYSTEVGKILATNLKAVGINTNLAPDVDVNVNPLNPVIHVRSFSDDPQLVAKLGSELSKAIQDEGMAATLKHFPGHGDTVTDSHVGLPIVNHNINQAFKIDLYPFKKIIETNPPDLIMTAHIQYPALDNSQIYASKSGEEIITPATLSRKIQFDLLRNQLGYQGVIITDALNMGAIAQHFDSLDATIKTFQAGDDIALMPITISQPQDIDKMSDMISKIESAVLIGKISEKEINESVLRILKLKIKLGLLQPDPTPLSERISRAQHIIAEKSQRDLESNLADDAVTLIQNNNQIIPLKILPNLKIHILTPWLEQGAGIETEIHRLQKEQFLPQELQVSFSKMADTDFETEKKEIDRSDIIIVGHSTTKSLPLSGFKISNRTIVYHQLPESLVFPDLLMGDISNYNNNKQSHPLFFTNSLPEDQFAYQTLQYAISQHKKTIFISLLAPYDLPNYSNVSDAMLAGYNYYGYLSIDQTNGYYRGPSMQALTRIIFGFKHAKGKLPINVPDTKNPTDIIYPRGYGLSNI